MYYSQKAVGCTVEGFAPSADAIAPLDIPDELKRTMQITRSCELAWLSEWEERIAAEVHPQVPGLLDEARMVRFASPRASVALLRSVAELVAASLGARAGGTLDAKLKGLEQRWGDEAPDKSPAGRRENARRESILACFHTMRDLGNRIHADSVVTPADVELAHNSSRRLLEAVLRVGPLDQE